jgi:hypothetical protein
MDPLKLVGLVESGTKLWAKQRRAEERSARARRYREEVLTSSYRLTIKDVIEKHLPEVYAAVTSSGKRSGVARQLFYRIRPIVSEMTGRELKDRYFTGTLLPRYVLDHPAAANWRIKFDPRGHCREPHTHEIVNLGTDDVADYKKSFGSPAETISAEVKGADRLFPTKGPRNRFSAVLLIEKEGFDELLEEEKLGEKWDIAIIGTKGHSTLACRTLVEAFSDIPVLVARDFDAAGFKIVDTLRNGSWRDEYTSRHNVIDIGLRLEDVHKYRLQAERCSRPDEFLLMDCGATREEIEFLKKGQRVELNAFDTENLIDWLEGKLKENGVQKTVPDPETLAIAYQRAIEVALYEQKIEDLAEEIEKEVKKFRVPKGLVRRVSKLLKVEPTIPWDEAVAREAEKAVEAKS